MIPPKRRKILALICIYYFSVFITSLYLLLWAAKMRLVSGQICG
ncbi:putative membrane protein [Escherichia coli 2-316-03_S3_C1]|nr:putative membrane protein [Escherichia coli 2-316-03_S3_C1]KEL66684.1 putative membrane protein [Escherichia coli 5-172-05_S1_C3]